MARSLDSSRRPREFKKPDVELRSADNYKIEYEKFKKLMEEFVPYEEEIDKAYQQAIDTGIIKEEEKDEGIFSEPSKQEEETVDWESLPDLPEYEKQEPDYIDFSEAESLPDVNIPEEESNYKDFSEAELAPEEEYITVEDLIKKYSDGGYIFLGHGTGRREDNESTITNSIFENGLRTKNNSLYYTSVMLDVPTPELKALSKESSSEEPSIDKLKSSLDHWPHLDSKDIIIVRVPTKYINTNGDKSDLDSEMFGAFMKEVPNGDKVTYYVNPKFVLGCYEVENGKIRLNPKFEKELSKETIDELEEGYKKAVQKTQDRFNSFNSSESVKEELEEAPINKEEEENNKKLSDGINSIISKMNSIYKTPILEDQITSINDLIEQYQFKFDLTYEEVEKLAKRVDELYNEAANIEKEDKKIKEQESKTNELAIYQNKLKEKYGIDWFTKISEEEKAKYIDLYSSAHNVSKESVQKNIEDSISLWNREHPKKEEVKSELEDLPDIPQSEIEEPKEVDFDKLEDIPVKEPEYNWETKNIFRFEERKALAVLKEVYSKIGNATDEQKVSFSASYTVLSNICKSTPTSAEEEQRLQTALFNVRDEINALNEQLSAPSMGGR